MAASELLRLIIDADAQGAVKGLTSVGQAADKNLKGAQADAQKLGDNLTKFGAVAVSVGAVAATGLFRAGQAASDLGETVSQSQQIFDEAAGKIASFAEGASGSLGQSERAAREAANTFGLFFTNAGKSADEAAGMSIELTKLASDMASFKNTSPEQAVEALGAALRGESEPIRAYGVMLDDATLKQRAMDMGLRNTTTGTLHPAIKMQAAYAEILEQTGTIQGDFERTSEGLANQQRILAAEFENAKAAIGQGALPVLTKLVGVAADAASAVSSLDKATGGVVGTLLTVATGAALVGGGLSVVAGQVIKAKDNLTFLKGPLTNATGGLSKLGKAGVIAGAAFAGWQIGKAIEGLTSMEISATKAMEATKGFTESMTAQEARGFAGLEGLGKLDKLFNDVAASSTEAAERMLVQAEAGGVSKEKIDELRASLQGKRDAEVQATIDTQAHSAAMAEAVPPTEAQAAATESAADKVERLKDELQAATEAIQANYSAMNEGQSLLIDYEAGIDGLTQSLKDNGTTLDISTEKGRANATQIMATGETIAALIQRRFEETGSTQAATDAGILYVENLKNQLREAGFTEGAIADLIAQMHLTPDEIRTNILADTKQAQADLSDYQRQIAAIPRTVTTSLGVRPNVDFRTGGNALGTPNWKGGLTWVGERGKELVDLPRGTAVYDANTSAKMAAGGQPVVVQIDARGATPQTARALVGAGERIAQAVARAVA